MRQIIRRTSWMRTASRLMRRPGAYVMHFDKDGLPPANAFWSLTMYDGNSKLLVDNPLNRYLLNSRMLGRLQRDADGGLTFYVQHDSPGKAKESNWLPAPPAGLVLPQSCGSICRSRR
ncbi:DUF1214 domain-containing protein [Cupriavidus basilensis]